MNQILYTGDNNLNNIEVLKTNKNRNKKIVSNKIGAMAISILVAIPITIIITINVSSLNMTSQAMYQNENLIQQTTSLVQEETNVNDVSNQIKNTEENVKEEQNTNEIINIDTNENINSNTKTENKNATNSSNKTNNKNTTSTNTTSSKKTSSKKSYSTIAYLNIPSLEINYPVLSRTSDALMKISLNKYWGANPNEVGNMCIVGHNYNDSRFFGKLNKIKKGAEVKITDTKGKTLTYKVYKTGTVGPYDTSCTSQLTNGHTEITLITCNYDGSKRFVVKARAN